MGISDLDLTHARKNKTNNFARVVSRNGTLFIFTIFLTMCCFGRNWGTNRHLTVICMDNVDFSILLK